MRIVARPELPGTPRDDLRLINRSLFDFRHLKPVSLICAKACPPYDSRETLRASARSAEYRVPPG
jgi:hypothetical protein